MMLIEELLRYGELRAKVLNLLTGKDYTVRELLNEINETGENYSYSTISTVLQRLEKEKLVSSKDISPHKRATKKFKLNPSVSKRKISNSLNRIITQFGSLGIKQLAEILEIDKLDIDLDLLRKRLASHVDEED